MNDLDLKAIEARLNAGTVTSADVRTLINELKQRPTLAEASALLKEGRAEFDRIAGITELVAV